MSELKPTAEESIRHFESQQKRYMREHNGHPCPHYVNAINALRRAQPAEPPVRCGECANYQTQNCAAKHEQALMDFCSHGIRKPGGEQDA